MTDPVSFSYLRYLQAKETVDERARNQHVWSQFIDRLADHSAAPLQILEVGAGEGATAQRILQALHDHQVDSIEYTLVDVVPDHLVAAKQRLQQWGTAQGLDVSKQKHAITFSGAFSGTLHFTSADLFDFARTHDGRFDVVVAQAVLDILPLSDALSRLAGVLREGGLWYLPIHFDGVTAFEPSISPHLDAHIERLYHQSMSDIPDADEGVAGQHTGRQLLRRFQQWGSTLVAAGSSDWVVFAGEEGYPADEAYFLRHILHFVEEELSGHPDLDTEAFDQWVGERQRQLERGELIYLAHQLDVLAQEGGTD